MVQLQDEILKLLKENEEQLKEVKFNDIKNARSDINLTALLNTLTGLSDQLKINSEEAINYMKSAFKDYNQAVRIFDKKNGNQQQPNPTKQDSTTQQLNNKEQNSMTQQPNSASNNTTPYYPSNNTPDYEDDLAFLSQDEVAPNATSTTPVSSPTNTVAPAPVSTTNKKNVNIKTPRNKASVKSKKESNEESELNEGIFSNLEPEWYKNYKSNVTKKDNAYKALKRARDNINNAMSAIGEVKEVYDDINDNINALYSKLDNLNKLIGKKISFFGRNFGFWK